jgi:NTE family protein
MDVLEGMKHKTYDTLVLGGGGTKGLSILGTLAYFFENHSLENLRRISGTSIGSVIGSLMGLRIPPREIYEIAKSVDVPFQGSGGLQNFSKKYGVWSLRKSLAPFFSLLLENFEGHSPTFEEYFRKTQIHLKICASNVNSLKLVYFDHESTPKVRVINAIRASCCLPGIFKAVKINGDYYVDGGFVENFPMGAWSGASDFLEEKILGISVSGVSKRAKIDSVFDYMYRTASLVIAARTKESIAIKPKALIVESLIEDVPFLPISVTEEIMEKLFEQGWLDAKTCASRRIYILH